MICNDYELELIRQKTGLGEAEILDHAGGLVVTKGEKGCTIILDGQQVDVAGGDPVTHRRSDRASAMRFVAGS